MEKYAGDVEGKDLAELEREGGWDILATLHGWAEVEDIWENYTNSKLERISHLSSVVFACMRKICQVAPDAAMEFGEWEGDSWEPDEHHWALDLMRQPNERMDYRTFTWSWLAHWLLTGESYIWKERNRGGDIIALHPYPTSWMSHHTREGKSWWEVSTGYGQHAVLQEDDVFVSYFPDPNNPDRGSGPMQACLKDLQIDDARAALMIEVLSNLHFAGTVVHSDEHWSEPQKLEMRRVLKDVIGPGKRASPLFTSGEGAKVEFPEPTRDIDWPSTADLAESRICAAWGVPPILIGLRVGLESATYSNYGQAKRAFYTETMRPQWDWMASGLERGLFRNEDDPDTEVEADYDDIPELQEDLDTLHERVLKDFHGGLLTLDQALAATDREELGSAKGGDVRLIPMSLVEFAPGAPAEPVPPRPEHGEEDEEEE